MANYVVGFFGVSNIQRALVEVEVEASGGKAALRKALRKSKRMRSAREGLIKIHKWDTKKEWLSPVVIYDISWKGISKEKTYERVSKEDIKDQRLFG